MASTATLTLKTSGGSNSTFFNGGSGAVGSVRLYIYADNVDTTAWTCTLHAKLQFPGNGYCYSNRYYGDDSYKRSFTVTVNGQVTGHGYSWGFVASSGNWATFRVYSGGQSDPSGEGISDTTLPARYIEADAVCTGVPLNLDGSVNYTVSCQSNKGADWVNWHPSIGSIALTSGSGTLTGIATPTYRTVTLNKDGGTGGTASVQAVQGAPMPTATAPTKADAEFGGYYEFQGGRGKQYYDADMNSAMNYDLAANTTLYAYWISDNDFYTIKFNKGYGGVGSMANQIIQRNQYTPLSACTFTKSGYQFAGWATTSQSALSPAIKTIVFTDCDVAYNYANQGASKTLYAQWKEYDPTLGGNTYIKVNGVWKKR